MFVKAGGFIVLSLTMMLTVSPARSEEQRSDPASNEPLTLGTSPADEALVDIVALPEYCKKVEPARAAEFDSRIAAAVAKQPANIQALIASPEFRKAVEMSVVKMSETKEPEDVDFLKMACMSHDPQP